MSLYKRGGTYWFKFSFGGIVIRRSAKTANGRTARDVEAAYRTQLVKGEVGIVARGIVPTLRDFEDDFAKWIDADKENLRTRAFYKTSYTRLCDFSALAGTRLDQIDEALIERFKTYCLKQKFGKTTINRYLATLRKALRYASRQLRMFDRLPVITMYSGERQREYVFSEVDYRNWIDLAPEPLRSASILARHSGICRGEMLALEKDCVHLLESADADGLFGEIEIRRGLKRDCRRRRLQVNAAMRDVLMKLIAKSECNHVFTALRDASKPLSPYTLEDQLGRVRALLKLHDDAGLHSLRHSFLTETAGHTDAFTLQYIAGHKRITTTMRYVHPQQESVRRAFGAREATAREQVQRDLDQAREKQGTNQGTAKRAPESGAVYH